MWYSDAFIFERLRLSIPLICAAACLGWVNLGCVIGCFGYHGMNERDSACHSYVSIHRPNSTNMYLWQIRRVGYLLSCCDTGTYFSNCVSLRRPRHVVHQRACEAACPLTCYIVGCVVVLLSMCILADQQSCFKGRKITLLISRSWYLSCTCSLVDSVSVCCPRSLFRPGPQWHRLRKTFQPPKDTPNSR
jgi:hypothetical protein